MASASWLALTAVRTFTPAWIRVGLFVAIGCLAALEDLGKIHIPHQRRQVPQSWLSRYGPMRSYALYGMGLGAGVLVDTPYAVAYPVFAASALLLPLGPAVAVGLLFGVGRSVLVGPVNLRKSVVVWAERSLPNAYRALPKVSALLSVAAVVIAIMMPNIGSR